MNKLESFQDLKNLKMQSYIWKGEKRKVDNRFVQDETKLVDASDDELKSFWNYCNTMLNNKSKDNPGRYQVLDTIKDQRLRCNAELYIRHVEAQNVPRFTLNEQIQKVLEDFKGDINDLMVYNVSTSSPVEFHNIPLNYVIDGCLDKLGNFNRKHLTLNFILKQGVWFTKDELEDLTEKDNDGNVINRLDVVRQRLNINSGISFNINPKGLSFTNLRAMLQLKNKKYSEMTTDQLTILRDRILFELEKDVKYHIKQWEERKEQIQEVAESRGITL
jgi:hypothetical protein